MKRILLSLLVACSLQAASPAPGTEAYFARVADSIYVVEGGKRAKVPYGILSVRVKSEADARRVCINTARNNWLRWQAAGRPGEYLDFLADRYCPPAADPRGNANWKRNIRAVMGRTS